VPHYRRWIGARRGAPGEEATLDEQPVDPRDRDRSSDLERVSRLLAGDEEALAEVRRWTRGALGPYRFRLAAEVEDLEQEVVVELLEALRAGRFEGRSRLSTYVRRMVHHKCLNRLRALRRRPSVDLGDVELVDAEPTPFERSRRREELSLGLRVLAEMPETCRELWGMIETGLSYEAMAERLRVASGTLRVRVHRCRERALALRDRLRAGSGIATAGNAAGEAVT
jgi:RNA polymerase sigma-70 factor (ECF subfamily)